MTPAEVEAAAERAVARFRARAGAVPDPPDRAEIPARVPVVLGPARDRYCMPSPGTCYCRTCAHWTPAPEPPYWSVPGSLDHARRGGRPPARRPERRAR